MKEPKLDNMKLAFGCKLLGRMHKAFPASFQHLEAKTYVHKDCTYEL